MGQDDEVVGTDVCVIGAGPVGLTIAERLAGDGHRVCIVEQGGGAAAGRRATRALRGENADAGSHRPHRSRAAGIGGTARIWNTDPGVRLRPMDPLDLAARPDIGRVGWPIPWSELEPWLAPAASAMGLDSPRFGAEDWVADDAPLLDAGPDVASVMFQFGRREVFARRYADLARNPRVTSLLSTTVLHLDVADDGRVAVAAVQGRERHVRIEAGSVVLATGGIENARLLLLSERSGHRAPGNLGGHVGRHFMEHPHIRTGVLVPWGRTLDTLDLYQRRIVGRSSVAASWALTPAALQREGILATVWSPHRMAAVRVTETGRALADLDDARELGRPAPGTRSRVATVVRDPLGTARALVPALGPGARRGVQLTTMAEQEPNPASRVLFGGARDAFGRPVARVDWRLTDLDRRSIEVGMRVLDRSLRSTGVGHVERFLEEDDVDPLVLGGHHHMGTTRMSTRPEMGVVDTDGRVHGTQNLYVAGTSVFPTGGYANPTFTGIALALRLASHLSTSVARPRVTLGSE